MANCTCNKLLFCQRSFVIVCYVFNWYRTFFLQQQQKFWHTFSFSMTYINVAAFDWALCELSDTVWTALGKVNIRHIFLLRDVSLYNLISMSRLQTANKAGTESKETTTARTGKPLCASFHFSVFAFPFSLIPSEWSRRLFFDLEMLGGCCTMCVCAPNAMPPLQCVATSPAVDLLARGTASSGDWRTVCHLFRGSAPGEISMPDLKVI